MKVFEGQRRGPNGEMFHYLCVAEGKSCTVTVTSSRGEQLSETKPWQDQAATEIPAEETNDAQKLIGELIDQILNPPKETATKEE